jgi:hypothetical protein
VVTGLRDNTGTSALITAVSSLSSRLTIAEGLTGSTTLVTTLAALRDNSGSSALVSSVSSLGVRLSALDATPMQYNSVNFLNGWSQYPDGAFGSVSYALRGGRVYLTGLTTGTQLSVAIFNLPVNFRPATTEIFVQPSDSTNLGRTPCEVRVHSDGDVSLETGSGTHWLALDGIHFAVNTASTQH